MSTNKDENAALASAIGMMVGIMAVMALAALALAVIAALILTVIAAFAWYRPLTIGETTIYPRDARTFVRRGMVGAVCLPLLILFLTVFFQVAIDWDGYFWPMVAIGYTVGSLGIEVLIYKQRELSAGATHGVTPHLSTMPVASSSHRGLPAPPAYSPSPSQAAPPWHATHANDGHTDHGSASTTPFRFATWDDEAERP